VRQHPGLPRLARQIRQRPGRGRRRGGVGDPVRLDFPAAEDREPIQAGAADPANIRLGADDGLDDPGRRHGIPGQQRGQAIDAAFARVTVERHRVTVGALAAGRVHRPIPSESMRTKMRDCGQPAFAAMAVLAVTAGACAGLPDEVQILIRRAELGDATVAVSVRDAETGVPLVALDAGRTMIPASNMKLLTTGAALHVLGPEFDFRTRLLADGDRLVIAGAGDPGFGDPDLLEQFEVGDQQGIDVAAFLDLWVDAAVTAGLGEISEVVVDDRIFDRRFVHPTWPADQLNRRYCAEVCGFNFHGNVLHFYPRPGTGERPDLELFRPYVPWMLINNRATTRRGVHDRNDIWIARKHDSNVLTFHGNVKHAYLTPVPVTIHDMPLFFARLLTERLRESGIPVARFRTADASDPDPAGRTVGPVVSTPISNALVRCNTDSQNLYAEALLKRIGHALTNEPGSWNNGTAVVRHVVHERLSDPNLAVKLMIRDGSGLSRENRIAAATMTAWLSTFHDDERIGEMFIASLARAGRTGTLARRFEGIDLHGTTVRAKSGYINYVSCLSGYVTAPDGRRRSFSILVNGLREPGSVGRAKKLQERILSAVAWDMTAAVTTLGDG
jgi:D-alanyl-D-alanine carboxypeptidase/D-alanyl-D-alanine-endopeptidase (penicillin-binding protein 4)